MWRVNNVNFMAFAITVGREEPVIRIWAVTPP